MTVLPRYFRIPKFFMQINTAVGFCSAIEYAHSLDFKQKFEKKTHKVLVDVFFTKLIYWTGVVQWVKQLPVRLALHMDTSLCTSCFTFDSAAC